MSAADPQPRWSKEEFRVAAVILNALLELPHELRMNALALACKGYLESQAIREMTGE